MASTVWRGYISFGLISIPVRLFRAARAERISLKRLYRQNEESSEFARAASGRQVDEAVASGAQPASASAMRGGSKDPLQTAEPTLTPVRQVSAKAESDKILSQKSIVKGFEFERDRFVALEAEELKSAAAKTSAAMEIEEFVRLDEIDPVYFEASYYVTPEEAGEKAYALLYRSLQRTGVVAIAQFAMHGREHVVVVRAGKTGLLAHTMFFATEVRAEEEFQADAGEVKQKELELAETLIRSLVAPFEPAKYRDSYREKLQSIIESKVQGQQPRGRARTAREGNVVDIADALRRSLADLKKPVSSVGSEQKAGANRGSRSKRASE